MKNVFNKRNLIIFMCVLMVLSILLFALSFFMGIKYKQYENELYKLQYDSTWDVSKKDEANLTLIHKKSKSVIDISMIKLTEDLANKDIEDVVDSVKLDIKSKNPNYSLITENRAEITNKGYKGYEMLFEDTLSQAMVRIGKIDDKLFSIVYVADNNCFDILLDSVDNIVNNFEVKIEKFQLKTNSVKIPTTGISFSKQDDYSIQGETSEYEINSCQYNVKYSIPKEFKLKEWNTLYGSYSYGDINLRTKIVRYNIDKYITDAECYSGIENEKKRLEEYSKKEPEKYTNLRWENEKLNNDLCEGYIYKQTYDYNLMNWDGQVTTRKEEKIYLLYALDYLRTFIIEIESNKTSIDEKIIQAIKLNSFQKYGEDIDINIENGRLTGIMRYFCDYHKEKYYELKFSIPSQYVETDAQNNKYERRYFNGGQYNEELDKYDYEIVISLNNLSAERYIEYKKEECNNDYNINGNIKFLNKITDGNLEFVVYSLEYTTKTSGKKHNELFAVASLPDGGRYVVEVTAKNEKSIPVGVIGDFLSGNRLEIKTK